jgi:hypothetical protein
MRWNRMDDGFLGSNEPPLIPPLGVRQPNQPWTPKTQNIENSNSNKNPSNMSFIAYI